MNYSGRQSKPYEPGQTKVYKVSRSKIELFTQCQRCFWLDQRLKVKRPSSPPFLINSAVDELLKDEFDKYRSQEVQHPLQIKFKIDAKPYAHIDLDKWRHNFTGVQYLHTKTNLLIFGAVDDVWINKAEELMVVDYKATAKTKEVKELGPKGGWHDSYRRQMEIYQWLLRNNDFKVSNTGYFVYANGDAKAGEFNDQVKFRTNVFPYQGDSSWVDDSVVKLKQCLESDIPKNDPYCEYCNYAKSRTELTLEAIRAK